jgi:hypothetical protein
MRAAHSIRLLLGSLVLAGGFLLFSSAPAPAVAQTHCWGMYVVGNNECQESCNPGGPGCSCYDWQKCGD